MLRSPVRDRVAPESAIAFRDLDLFSCRYHGLVVDKAVSAGWGGSCGALGERAPGALGERAPERVHR